MRERASFLHKRCDTQGLSYRFTLLTMAYCLAALACFLVFVFWQAIQDQTQRVKDAINTVGEMSMEAYHLSAQLHIAKASAAHANHGAMSHGSGHSGDDSKALHAATKKFRMAVADLAALIDGAPHQADPWSAPMTRLAQELGLLDPPEGLVAIWRGGDVEQSLKSLLKAQAGTCIDLCTSPHMAPEDRAAAVEEMGAVAVREIAPLAARMSDATAIWRDGVDETSRQAVTWAFVIFAGSMILMRVRIIGPLIAQLNDASRIMEERNENLERMVAARTAELTRALEDANAAVAAKQAFLAHMSHEIRTPMNGVLGIAALLDQTPLDKTQRNYVDTIRSSGGLLMRIIDGVLDIASMASGKAQIELTPVALDVLVRDTVQLLSPVAEGKGLALDLKVKGRKQMVMADPHRFAQVLNNFIGNAIKYTEVGGVRVRLAQSVSNGQVHARIKIEDSGCGISVEDLSRIFQPFERAASAAAAKGAGLGLALSRSLVEAMGGRVEVESVVGRGSAFCIHLSFAAAPEPAQDAPVGRLQAA